MITRRFRIRITPPPALAVLALTLIAGLPALVPGLPSGLAVGQPALAQMVIDATTTVRTGGPPEARIPNPAAGPAADPGTAPAAGPATGESLPTASMADGLANRLMETVTAGDDAIRDAAADAAGDAPAEAASLATLPAGPLPQQPVVVELYTAQGCSSCPPVDALLAEMADRPNLLALAFHVDYWDYLGWQDQFASPAFTERQRAYARAFRERGLYTPQIIIGGTDTLLTPRPADLDMLIAAHRARPPALALTLERDEGRRIVTLTPRRTVATNGSRIEVLFLRYLPRRVVQMNAGENQGRQVEYRNIVARIDKLADWDGRKMLRLGISPGADEAPVLDARGQPLPADTRHAIIVQQAGPGPVLAAIRLD